MVVTIPTFSLASMVIAVASADETIPSTPPPAAAQVPSPLKKTPLLAVPLPSLAVGTVPLVS